MSWNPDAGSKPWNMQRLRALATQPADPATGVGMSQGQLYDDQTEALLQRPQDMSINETGWVNPYSLTMYQFPLSTVQATRVIPPNLRRAYLIIQNQGPGNVFINFGQDVIAASNNAGSNGMLLIQTQIYEQIGGGDIDDYGVPRAGCFVSPDYVSCIADQDGTTILVGEGVWRYITPPGASG